MASTHLKHNATGYADALVCEAEGLERLAGALDEAGVTDVGVPHVYRVNETELEITAIRSSGGSDRAREVLGEGLARMHALRQEAYGWGRDNYIGLAPQPNRWCDNWGEFFVHDRLGYQVSRIRDASQRTRFEQVLDQHGGFLMDWLNAHCEHPSLLHGDLCREAAKHCLHFFPGHDMRRIGGERAVDGGQAGPISVQYLQGNGRVDICKVGIVDPRPGKLGVLRVIGGLPNHVG